MKLKYTILFFVSSLGMVLGSFIFFEQVRRGQDLPGLLMPAMLSLLFFISVIWTIIRSGKDQRN